MLEANRDQHDPSQFRRAQCYLLVLHPQSMECMTSKTIALDPEAYDLLRRQKVEGESFSDVGRRLSRRRRSDLDFAGAWKDVPKKDLDRIREFLRSGRELERKRND